MRGDQRAAVLSAGPGQVGVTAAPGHGYRPDQARAEIRAPAPGDRNRIAAMWQRCGPGTRMGRFHAPVRNLPSSYLNSVLADPDASVVAALPGTDLVIGVASLFRAGTDGTAELGVLVEDVWQRHGIGRRLVSRLIQRAPCRGITALTASILARNETVTQPLRQVPGTYSATNTGPTVQITITLGCPLS